MAETIAATKEEEKVSPEEESVVSEAPGLTEDRRGALRSVHTAAVTKLQRSSQVDR